jgi:hypothetical protein
MNRLRNIVLAHRRQPAAAAASQHYFLEPRIVLEESMGSSWEGR